MSKGNAPESAIPTGATEALQARRTELSRKLPLFLLLRIHSNPVELSEELAREVQDLMDAGVINNDVPVPVPADRLLEFLYNVWRGRPNMGSMSQREWVAELVCDRDVLDFILYLLNEHLRETNRAREHQDPTAVCVVDGRLRDLISTCVSFATVESEARRCLYRLLMDPVPPTPELLEAAIKILTTARMLVMRRPTGLDRPIVIFRQDTFGEPNWRTLPAPPYRPPPKRSLAVGGHPAADAHRSPQRTGKPIEWRRESDDRLRVTKTSDGYERTIKGPALVALADMVMSRPFAYLTWEEVQEAWPRGEGEAWKRPPSLKTLQKYGRRVQEALDDLRVYWHQHGQSVSWRPPT